MNSMDGVFQNRVFQFAINKEEYLEFLRFRYGLSKESKNRKLWITTSIPTLIIVSDIFFKLYNRWQYILLSVLLITLWIFVAVPRIWKWILGKQFNESIFERVNIKAFENITAEFRDKNIVIKDRGNNIEINYKDVSKIIPINNMFVILYKGNGVILLPYRAFKEDKDIKEFLMDIEKKIS